MFVILHSEAGRAVQWRAAYESEDKAIQEAAEITLEPEDMIMVVEAKYFQQNVG